MILLGIIITFIKILFVHEHPQYEPLALLKLQKLFHIFHNLIVNSVQTFFNYIKVESSYSTKLKRGGPYIHFLCQSAYEKSNRNFSPSI